MSLREEERQKSLSVETGSHDVIEHLIGQLKFKNRILISECVNEREINWSALMIT